MAENPDNIRRDFDLPEEDVEHLNARGLPWETVNEGNAQWLLVHNFPIPEGYNTRVATAALLIPQNYPTPQLDMVYFHPAVLREDGISIPNIQCSATIQGRFYQGWSRHRTPENPWRVGLDGVATHLGLVEEWLLREFRMRPKGLMA